MNRKLAIILTCLLYSVPVFSDSNRFMTIGGIEVKLGMPKKPLLAKYTGKYELIELSSFPGVVSLIDKDDGVISGRLWFKEGRLSSAAKQTAEINGVEAVKFGDQLFATVRYALAESPGKAAVVAIETERSEGLTKDDIQLLIDNILIKITITRSDKLNINAVTVEQMLVSNLHSSE